jgi:hypothetical protein
MYAKVGPGRELVLRAGMRDPMWRPNRKLHESGDDAEVGEKTRRCVSGAYKVPPTSGDASPDGNPMLPGYGIGWRSSLLDQKPHSYLSVGAELDSGDMEYPPSFRCHANVEPLLHLGIP